jgi:hypothetical protein
VLLACWPVGQLVYPQVCVRLERGQSGSLSPHMFCWCMAWAHRRLQRKRLIESALAKHGLKAGGGGGAGLSKAKRARLLEAAEEEAEEAQALRDAMGPGLHERKVGGLAVGRMGG